MATRAQWSEFNILNSIAIHLAGRLIQAGYLVYWQQRDALQTDDGWYVSYSTQLPAYKLDATFAADLANAKGIVTLVDAFPAEPRFVTRPTLDGSVPEQDTIAVPAMALEIGAPNSPERLEVGWQGLRVWVRHLVVEAFVRSRDEQARFKDWLGLWLDEDVPIEIRDHDSGSVALLAQLAPQMVRIDAETFPDAADAMTYQVLVNARLEYVA